jgi:hypothetical protein
MLAHCTAFLKVQYPQELSGIRLNPPADVGDLAPYSPIPKIPSYFWMSMPITSDLPIQPEPRRALLYDVTDIIHFHICSTTSFHLQPDEEECICRFCQSPASHYHHRTCTVLRDLSPSALLRKTFHTRARRECQR